MVVDWHACSGEACREAGKEAGREKKESTGVESIGGDKGAGVEVEGNEGGIFGEEGLDRLGGDAPAVTKGEAFQPLAMQCEGEDSAVGNGGTEAEIQSVEMGLGRS